MAKNFSTLRARRSPEARARAHALAQKYEAQMALAELREARKLTQTSLAQALGMKQPAVSKMERQADMYVSTLRSIVRAMGGRLRIEAVFPEGTAEISQFTELKHESPIARPSKKRARNRVRLSGPATMGAAQN